MYSFHRFKQLSTDAKIKEISHRAVALDLAYTTKNTEALLFAYSNFYVELVVQKYTGGILAIHCFTSVKKLEPYLVQVDISQISSLLCKNT